MTAQGKFITFEGGEGAGKSTQIKRLSAHLQEMGVDHIVTREPGGSDLAERIRGLLVQGAEDSMDPLCEYLLFSAARRDHLARVIQPALAQGLWVLCDRFYDSSVVYQGIAPEPKQALSSTFMDEVYTTLAGPNFCPHVTFIFDLDPDIGLARVSKRVLHQSEGDQDDRFESKGTAFHQRVRDGFLARASDDPLRCHVLDASLSEQAVYENLLAHLRTLSYI